MRRGYQGSSNEIVISFILLCTMENEESYMTDKDLLDIVNIFFLLDSMTVCKKSFSTV